MRCNKRPIRTWYDPVATAPVGTTLQMLMPTSTSVVDTPGTVLHSGVEYLRKQTLQYIPT